MILQLRGEIGEGKQFSAQTVRQLIDHKPGEIHVEIETDGGDADEAFSIYHTLRALPIEITAHVANRCWSAGVIVLMAASRRSASPKTSLLLHPASVESDELKGDRLTAAVLADHAREMHKIDSRITDLVALRTGCDRTWLAREIATETELSATEALRHGILTEIS